MLYSFSMVAKQVFVASSEAGQGRINSVKWKIELQ
jgi:hypothetical protein